eukprot:scaffold100184_cov17-Tisochrysis_lutea.AAC.1
MDLGPTHPLCPVACHSASCDRLGEVLKPHPHPLGVKSNWMRGASSDSIPASSIALSHSVLHSMGQEGWGAAHAVNVAELRIAGQCDNNRTRVLSFCASC